MTEVDFRALYDFHIETRAELTVGVRKYEMAVPFGVVEAEGTRVTGLVEKPSYSFFINAGIYLLEPAVLALIPPRQRFDMTALIQLMIAAERPVTRFPIHENWIDIGQHKDLMRMSAAAAARQSV